MTFVKTKANVVIKWVHKTNTGRKPYVITRKKAKAHAQWESMNKNEDVQKRKEDVNKTVARKRILNVGVENAKKRKMVRDDKRNGLLGLNLVATKLETLREQKEALYMEKGEVRTNIFDKDFVIE